jgi:hypothetical protein
MIPEPIKQRLRDNWGDKANAMECYAEVKLIDPVTSWTCYVYALDPGDEDTILCLFPNGMSMIGEWSLDQLNTSYNLDGEYLVIDTEYRPMIASTLYRKLQGKK